MTLANPFAQDPRVYNEAKSLVKAGHNVTVLAWDKKKIYPSIELKDGINVVRSYNTRFMDLLPYDIFRLHFWWGKGYRDALKLYKEDPFDVVHSHDLSSLPIGVKLKKKLGCKLIYDAHEIWGYMVSWKLPWWRYYLWKEKQLLFHVDHMIVTNSARKAFYSKKSGCNITIIDNYKHIISQEYVEPANYEKKHLSILYIGALSKKRFLLELIEVVEGLQNVDLKIGGYGELHRTIKEKSSSCDNINFLGVISPERIISLTLKNDVVIRMAPSWDKNDATASTNKQYEAMIAGRPIITSKGTFSGRLTNEENVGIAIEHSRESLKNAIIELRDNPELRRKLGRNALKAAIREYNWEKQEEELEGIYERIKK